MIQKGENVIHLSSRTVRFAAAILLMAMCGVSRGQTFDTEFYPPGGWSEWDEAEGFGEGGRFESGGRFENGGGFDPQIDESIFATPVWDKPDPFRDFSKYRFGAVRYRERGLDSRRFGVTLGGIDLTDNLSSYPDWNIITLARRAGLAAAQTPAMVATGRPAKVGRSENYSLHPSGDDLYIILRTGDRYAQGGGELRHSHASPSGWSWTVAAAAQAGDDSHFKGVYTDEAGGVVSLSKRWTRGASLTLLGIGGETDRGSRTAATLEAFDLAGDIHYNPVWGQQGGREMQGGRVRNSRTTRARFFFAAAELQLPLGEERMLSLTVAMRSNRGGRTRLAWYDASSPMPDYYRSMPSFLPDWEAAEMVADAWRAGDRTVTQLDWRKFYYNNTLAPDGRATYIVEEQVEQARDLHASLTVDRRVAERSRTACGRGATPHGFSRWPTTCWAPSGFPMSINMSPIHRVERESITPRRQMRTICEIPDGRCAWASGSGTTIL